MKRLLKLIFLGWFYRSTALTTINISDSRKHYCKHVPLLEIDGRIIEGTKRCKFCGLNESYW